jgi:hypothetical protein
LNPLIQATQLVLDCWSRLEAWGRGLGLAWLAAIHRTHKSQQRLHKQQQIWKDSRSSGRLEIENATNVYRSGVTSITENAADIRKRRRSGQSDGGDNFEKR